MKKYVVTGGAGFIGSALVRGLLALGDGSVEVIDNLSTGRRENLDEISSRITFHPTDIRDFDEILPLISSADTVFHIAAIPSVPEIDRRSRALARMQHRRHFQRSARLC